MFQLPVRIARAKGRNLICIFGMKQRARHIDQPPLRANKLRRIHKYLGLNCQKLGQTRRGQAPFRLGGTTPTAAARTRHIGQHQIKRCGMRQIGGRQLRNLYTSPRRTRGDIVHPARISVMCKNLHPQRRATGRQRQCLAATACAIIEGARALPQTYRCAYRLRCHILQLYQTFGKRLRTAQLFRALGDLKRRRGQCVHLTLNALIGQQFLRCWSRNSCCVDTEKNGRAGLQKPHHLRKITIQTGL